jgi:UPF0755 protein
MKKKVLVAGLLLMALLLMSAGLWFWHATTSQVVLSSEVVVTIPVGAGAGEAARRLSRAGVIRSAMAFRVITGVHGVSHRLQAGEYQFAGALAAGDVVHRLVDGDVLLHAITIPEGLTRLQIVQQLREGPVEIAGDIDAATEHHELIRDLDPAAENLEGYLFPDTYQVARGTHADVIIAGMVARFRQVVAELTAESEEKALLERSADVRAWVTLASLVEKETGLPAERSRVAGVFVNRLDLGMPLQCDPTVVYALAQADIPQQGSLAKWLDLDHKYNTYRYPGLPPGPIANPGRAALAAALQPEAGDDLYFVADGKGGHRFSPTLAQHNRAVRQWRQHQAQARQP